MNRSVSSKPPCGETVVLDKTDVVIVGAGPSGLMAANLLACYGVSFRIVEKQRCKDPISSEECIQPRTLEILESLGLRDKVERRGKKIAEFAVYDHVGGLINRIRVGPEVSVATDYRWSVSIDKGAFEEILEQNLLDLGVSVIRDCCVISIRYRSLIRGLEVLTHRIRALRSETYCATFVLRCDGPDNNIAGRFQVPIEQKSSWEWIIADGYARTDFPDAQRRCTVRSAHGSCVTTPLKDNRIKIRMLVSNTTGEPRPGGTSQEDTLEPPDGRGTQDTLFLNTYAQKIFAPYSIEFSSPSRVQVHIVRKFLASRFADTTLSVFILGSAGHVHSPLTRQGLNAGIMDAWNLAWKLGLFVKGFASRSILLTYDLERRGVLQKAATFEAQVDEIFFNKDESLAAFTGMHDFEEASGYTSGCGVRYPPNALVRDEVRTFLKNVPQRLEPGKRLLLARLIQHVSGVEEDLWTWFPVDLQFKLILFVGHIIGSPIVRGACNYLDSDESPLKMRTDVSSNEKFLDLIIVHSLPHLDLDLLNLPSLILEYSQNLFEDRAATWHENLGINPNFGALCLVRPDGYIALVSNLDDCTGVTRFLEHLRESETSM